MRDVSDEALWGLILPYVRRPTPAALSSPPRSDLRQQTLATCMRVCKLFESICEPLLYSVIATDVLHKLLGHIHSPSLRRRLGWTRRLLIEYEPNPSGPTYDTIMRKAKNETWPIIGASTSEVEESIAVSCELEKRDLMRAVEAAIKAAERMEPVFLHLESVAIASIYGADGGRWQRFMEWESSKAHPPGWGLAFTQPTNVFCAFLSTYKVQHLCIRDPFSPLTLQPMSWASDPNGPIISYSVTQHFGPEIEQFILPLGHPVRWVSDASSSVDLSILMDNVRAAISDLQSLREMPPSGPRSPKVWPDVADVQVYCTTAMASAPDNVTPGVYSLHPISTEKQAVLAEDVTTYFTQDFKRKSGVNDSIRWYTSEETPTCKACLSGVPV